MSVPAGTDAVTDAPIAEAQKNAIDDAEKHTPEVTPPPPPANTAGDPSDGTDGIKELREQVGVLGETVNTLVKTVETLAATATGNRDEGAGTKLPFLLRGKKDKE